MSRRCLATHPSGGQWAPTCSHDHGHTGPHTAAWTAFSLSGRVEAGGETWDNEEDAA